MGALAGKVAVITGAGAGLGRSYALALSLEGAAIVVNDVDVDAATTTVAEITDAGGSAVIDSNRVGGPAAADAMVALAVDTYGRVDVMVTNAGADRRGPVLDLTPEDWAVTLDVHLAGSIHCSLAAARAMRDAGDGGSIINVTSAAFHAGTPTMAPYCVSKGGIYSLTRALALELAPHGISVNAVSPPLTATAPALAFVDEMVSMASSTEFEEALRASIEQPEQVAPIVTYLASDRGRRLTGRVFTLTSGALVSTDIDTATAERGTGTSVPWSLDELDAAVASLS